MRKVLFLLLALLFAAAANLRLCWTVDAGEERAEGLSLAACVRGLRAAEAAANELGADASPRPELRPALSWGPASQDAGTVSDLLLRRTGGVAVAEGCRAKGVWLGCAGEGEDLALALRRQIFSQRPPGALTGRWAEELQVEPVYTRAGQTLAAEALARRAFETVPVIYSDGDGKLVEA